MKYSEYQPRPDLLKDRIILITGAGDGIACVRLLLVMLCMAQPSYYMVAQF